jgi:hypothetical protein
MDRQAVTGEEALELARRNGVKVHLDGDELVLEADAEPLPGLLTILGRGKSDIVHALRQREAEERRWIVQWINANFSSSSPDFCRHCRRGLKPGDAFVRLYCGDDSGVVHQSCWQAWQAAGDAQARRALGLDR